MSSHLPHRRSHKLHFIGVTASQLVSAIRIWGEPDFVHKAALWSLLGDIPAEDIVIFGSAAFPIPKKWRKKHLMAHSLHNGA